MNRTERVVFNLEDLYAPVIAFGKDVDGGGGGTGIEKSLMDLVCHLHGSAPATRRLNPIS